eukprot:TRINITY_DN1105_c0_g1_i1.p1 TRINITY_DN1105_c0_g1~~TRINITY_DN1105_c0_g1_i1.p1  ORF type:complete len:183 (-),score=57.40 TRINITY_DN1105_c0_g1_i1:88-636(-)
MAGILPFAIHDGEMYFLFHRTFVGKKMGTLIDMGGGISKEDNKDIKRTAAREFSEETAGLYFSEDPEADAEFLHQDNMTESDMQQGRVVRECTERVFEMLQKQPVWVFGGYKLHVLEIPYHDLKALNKAFEKAPKKREFLWVHVNDIIQNKTVYPLFARVSRWMKKEDFGTILSEWKTQQSK